MDLHAVAIRAHHLERIAGYRQPERNGKSVCGISSAGQQPHAPGIARHVLEQDRGRLGPGVTDDLGERTHFEIPMGAWHAQQFT